MDRVFDPERYGMRICPECKGQGSLLQDSESLKVCPKCGGFGLIKKEEDPRLAGASIK